MKLSDPEIVQTIVIKQALPYIRCVGESWPLTLERATFEMKALIAHGSICPELTPKVLHFEEAYALMILEYIPPPHIILRRALIAQHKVIGCFKDIAVYMARTLIGTSSLTLNGPDFRSAVAEWSRNTSMCAVTEQVIFSDPYIIAPLNRHNSPFLDSIVACIRTDCELIIAASTLKGTSTNISIHSKVDIVFFERVLQ
jgi:5-methylthioribose kinase